MSTVHVHLYDDALTRSGHRQLRAALPVDRTLAALIRCVRERVDLPTELVVAVGQRAVEPADWSATTLRADEHVRIAPKTEELGTLGALAIGLALSAVSAGLSLLLTPKPPDNSDTPEERRFGFNRVTSDAFAGDAIPVVLGRRVRYGGKVIARIPGEGEDGDTRVKILICYGHGPIKAIGSLEADADRVSAADLTGIYFNDQPISSFPTVRVSARMGTPDQAVIPGFDDTETLREVGVGGRTLENNSGFDVTGSEPGDDVVSYLSAEPVDSLVLRVRFPAGLFRVSSSGQVDAAVVSFRYRQRLVDAGGSPVGSWSDWTTQRVEQSLQAPFFSSPRIDGLAEAGAPAYREVQIERVTKTPDSVSTTDEMIFDSVTEIVLGENTYPGMALLALELVADEQLQDVPQVSADVQGQAALRQWDGLSDPSTPVWVTGYSANPAWHALEILTNTTWGMGAIYGDDWIDTVSLIEWAQFCDAGYKLADQDERRPREFNGVLDAQAEGVEVLRAIAEAGRCIPVPAGRLWRFVVDRAQAAPVETFTDGSIARAENGDALFEYERVHATGDGRPNQLIAQFENELQDGRVETIAWPADGELWLADETPNPLTLRLDGVTRPEQVVDELNYRMKKIRFLTRSIRFTTTHAFPAVLPGERFDLAMSLPGYGLASGRTLAGSTFTGVKIDRTVTLPAIDDHGNPASYTLRIVHDDGSIEERTVAEYGTFTTGQEIPLTSALTRAPVEFAEYALGQPGIQVKPFLCTGVYLSDTEQLLWDLEGVEYDEEVYDEDATSVTIPDYSSLRDGSTPPGPVTALRCFQRTKDGVDYIVLAWSQTPEDREITAGFRIYRRLLGLQSWQLTSNASVSLSQALITEIADADASFEFIVVAVSFGGRFLSPNDPRHPRCSLVFGFGEEPPPPPTGLTLAQDTDNTYTLAWNAVQDAVGYQVLAGGDPTSTLPNGGAEGCFVLARPTANQLTGLELTPGQRCDFWVRSVGRTGRMSVWTAGTPAAAHAFVASPATPAGESIRGTSTWDLSTDGTRDNLAWNASTGRLELVTLSLPGVWTSPEVDLGSPAASELTFRAGSANDADDPTLSSDFLLVPSIAADQWGVTNNPSTGDVGMLTPPYPDNEHGYAFEYRVHDGGGWGSWTAIEAFASVQGTIERYQFRVTLTRQSSPYRPALRSMVAVVTG